MWIKIVCYLKWIILVTSLAEVWIEIFKQCLVRAWSTSHFPCGSVDWNCHAPHQFDTISPSLPLRKCGLKLTSCAAILYSASSLPLRKCGLKFGVLHVSFGQCSHFPCGSVDWNDIVHGLLCRESGHFPCGSVDWNPFCRTVSDTTVGHFPCGSVDWNIPYGHNPSRLEWSLPLRKCGLK